MASFRFLLYVFAMIVVAVSNVVLMTSGASSNMNGKPYKIANPNPKASSPFSGEYAQYSPESKYFDVYSPLISTRYGQVYWTMMDAVPLPPDIVSAFDGKVIAITGYESNQVQRTPNGDVSLPITAAYNHHYTAYVNNHHAVLKQLNVTANMGGHADSNGNYWAFVDSRPEHEQVGPASAALHEGNGGEFRQSFHGFSSGFAQLVESPTEFVMNPMQIDTWNRENKNFSGFWPGPEPKNSEAPSNAVYSGLLECPCTTRMTKDIDATIMAQLAGSCATKIADPSTCDASHIQQLKPWTRSKITTTTGSNASMPPGCSILFDWNPKANPPGSIVAYFNTLNTSTTQCGENQNNPVGNVHMFGGAAKEQTEVGVGLWVEIEDQQLRLTITGPSDVWFGVGLNASSMANQPYTVIVDGQGNVTERLLGNHAPGTLLQKTLTVESMRVIGGRRTVVVSRSITPTSSFRFSLDGLRATAALPLIVAVGNGADFSIHKSKSSVELTMFNVGSPTCVCESQSEAAFGKGKGYLIYQPPAGEPGSPGSNIPGASTTSLRFAKNCLEYPYGTMLLEQNPSCDIRAYTGGQSCCHHLVTLLDKDQPTPWVDQPLEYNMKFRIYYREATNFTNVVQHNWGGMATPTEYDVPQCHEGLAQCSKDSNGDWVHLMNGSWTVGEMTGGKPFQPVVIHGHCHAPTCINFTLYNADTNEIICNQQPDYGHSNATFDEQGYLSVPPCVFGSDEGLLPVPNISSNTRLFSTKFCKANSGHHGEMSLWQTYNRI